MVDLMPYIDFVDKSREAVRFYKDVFGGDAEVQSEERIIHLDFQSGGQHMHLTGIIIFDNNYAYLKLKTNIGKPDEKT